MKGAILCPVDLASPAPRVVALASVLARARGARVILFHATDPRDGDPGAAGRLEALAAALGSGGIPVDTAMEEGEPVPAILEYATRVDLVVMGTHGGRGVERMLLGSVAERVLDHAPCPVATVREASPGAITRIVCGVDLVDAAPLGAAVALARETGAEVIALHAVAEAPEEGRHSLVPASYAPSLLAEARERLEAAIAALGETGVRIRGSVVPGRAHRQLVRRAAEESASLVVVGVHPHLFGGTAHRVVREAECPVLTVRGAPASEESYR